MKKAILLIPILLLFNSKIFSADKTTSSLNLSLYDGGIFTVVFDGKETTEPTNEADYSDIEAGKYFLKVVKETMTVPATPSIIFSDYIIVPVGCKIFAVIDESGKFYIYKKINDYEHYTESRRHECHCDCEYCRNCIYKTGNINRNDSDDACKNRSMNENDFNNALKTVSGRSFESTKLDMSKQIIDQNVLTCDQLKELLNAFAFEDSKVQLAEYAYDKICDQKNYSKIYDVFSFESSIQVIQDYISKKK